MGDGERGARILISNLEAIIGRRLFLLLLLTLHTMISLLSMLRRILVLRIFIFMVILLLHIHPWYFWGVFEEPFSYRLRDPILLIQLLHSLLILEIPLLLLLLQSCLRCRRICTDFVVRVHFLESSRLRHRLHFLVIKNCGSWHGMSLWVHNSELNIVLIFIIEGADTQLLVI